MVRCGEFGIDFRARNGPAFAVLASTRSGQGCQPVEPGGGVWTAPAPVVSAKTKNRVVSPEPPSPPEVSNWSNSRLLRQELIRTLILLSNKGYFGTYYLMTHAPGQLRACEQRNAWSSEARRRRGWIRESRRCRKDLRFPIRQVEKGVMSRDRIE